MARNRVIYQSEAVSVGAFDGGQTNLKRVQSCNYNFTVERVDVNQFGNLASIDRLIVQEPTVAVDLTYFFESSLSNETALGFSNSGVGHMLSALMTGAQQNIVIRTSAAGTDATGTVAGTIAIGNAFLTSWSLEAAVGSLATVSCAFEGQNIGFAQSTSVNNPTMTGAGLGAAYAGTVAGPTPTAIVGSTDVSAIRPGDITVSIEGASVGLSETDLKIQSVTLGLTMAREPLRKLGSFFAFSKELTFPITCTMSIAAVVGDLTAEALNSVVNSDSSVNCTVTLVGRQITAQTALSTATFALFKAKINSQNITSSIGPNKSVTIELSAQIGVGSGLTMATA